MSTSPFSYRRATSVADATAATADSDAMFLAGGTDFLPLWKAGILSPEAVVDISRLPLTDMRETGQGVTIGALARLADVAAETRIATTYPLVVQAINASASGQVRNMATVGGNLLQRTRCVYFRNPHLPCDKRTPGSGCGARGGENRQHALFAPPGACVATHPSDLAVALAALDAGIEMTDRTCPIDEFYTPPDVAPERDTVLRPGELVTAVRIPDAARFAARSAYLKIRDRASFEFAVVSVACALDMRDGAIVEARLAAGGVAHKPWRLTASENALRGRPAEATSFAEAAARAIDGARPLQQNGFKIELLRRAVIRALEMTRGRA